MSVEEIGYEPRPPGRRGLGGVVVVLVVVGAVAWVLLKSNGGSVADPDVSSSPTVSASPSFSEAQRPGIADAQLQLGEVCAPTPVGARSFDVRFTLVNTSPAGVILLRVVPSLPLGGLTLLDTTVSDAACLGPPGSPLVQPTVPAGGSVLVVFRFRLPKDCPAALPVQADVTSRVFNVSQSGHRQVIPVYPDLSAFGFTSCE